MAILRPTFVCPVSHLPQDGSSELDLFHGGAMGPDGSSVLAGTSGNASVFLRRFGCGRYSEELFLSTLTTTYLLLYLSQELTRIFVFAGFTQGSWDGTLAGVADMAAVKLDAEGNELWRYQVGCFLAT